MKGVLLCGGLGTRIRGYKSVPWPKGAMRYRKVVKVWGCTRCGTDLT
jgi:hypothetical protein